MKEIIILIVSSIVLGCNFNDSRINTFEKALPDRDLVVLNRWVEFYDSLVSINYSENEFKGQHLLSAIVEKKKIKLNNLEHKICDLIAEINHSTLEEKTNWFSYDSVFIGRSLFEPISNDSMIITIDQDGERNEELVIVPNGNGSLTEQMNYIKNKGYERIVSESTLINALEKIDGPEELYDYLNRRKEVGRLNYRSVAESWLESEINFDSYFLKRILIVEVIYPFYSNEYEC